MSGTTVSRPPNIQRPDVSMRMYWMGLLIAAVSAIGGAYAAARNLLPPSIMSVVAPQISPTAKGDSHAGAESHSDHHEDHGEEQSLDLSPQARKNIGLKIGSVALSDFQRTITIPGIVEERPGRSTIEIAAPMTGVITRLSVSRGNAVTAGQLLFELRLTHEELVQAQSDLLRTVEELDVISQEVKRLESITSAAIAGKSILERKYEQQKAQAVLRAQRQALILHGLSESQVDEILTSRTLLHQYQVHAPSEQETSAPDSKAPLFQVQALHVARGQNVTAGDNVMTLSDHSQLFIAGNAFEKDIADLQRALEKGWTASAVVESDSGKPEIIPKLEIVNLDNHIDLASRTINVYILLPNTVQRDSKASDGFRFLQWRFKPGQRMQIRIPVETWSERIVLPLDAVVQDGVDWFVFVPNGDQVVRRTVHVEYRDQFNAVIANDGALFPGDAVCLTGAQQLQLALKNKAGGGVDPHAGHSH